MSLVNPLIYFSRLSFSALMKFLFSCFPNEVFQILRGVHFLLLASLLKPLTFRAAHYPFWERFLTVADTYLLFCIIENSTSPRFTFRIIVKLGKGQYCWWIYFKMPGKHTGIRVIRVFLSIVNFISLTIMDLALNIA